ncbi:MAG TPA: FapA family protein [Phycisphaerae bacterium]|nr:FapA family protein [Phycisphaerae bacterium]
MGNPGDSKPTRVTVEVSADRLTAKVRPASGDDPQPLTQDEVLAAVQGANIPIDDAVKAKIGAFVSAQAGGNGSTTPFVIAEGRPAVEPKDAEFILDESLKGRPEAKDEDHVDYYSFNSVVTVEAGTPIGRLTPIVPGAKGVDVYGKAIEPKNQPVEVKLESTVRRAENDPAVVIAAVDGKISYKDHTLSMSDLVSIDGNVDFECGNINAATDVSVGGTILDLFKVQSKKSIRVGGAIQAAEVEAGGDVTVRGGILGREKGFVKAGGCIVAKFAEEANLTAGGDVRITRECMNTRVRAEGKFLVSRGAVIGGDVYGREGVEVGAIGSEAGIQTCVTVGIHPSVLDEADAITEECKTKLKAIERIRTSVQPLMANLKRLTPEQKERATELLYTANAMVAEIGEAEARRDTMIEQGRAKSVPGVFVAKVIRAGSRIRIGRRHVVFDFDVKGPIRIEKRKVDKVTEFVAVSQLTASVTVLRSAYVVSKKPTDPSKVVVEATKADHGSGR